MSGPKIPLAGVIGHPIAHSKSPRLHGHWLKSLGIAGHYIPMDVAPENLEETLRLLPKIGFRGVNITLPHKQAAMQIADLVTDRAALIGAANTLIFRKDGRIHADNTDGYGFVENIKSGAPTWKPKEGPAAVLGAGGASAAIVSALLEVGVPEVRISNRTRVRAEGLRERFGARVTVYDWVQAGNMIDEAVTVVNSTSLGMEGMPELRVPLDGLSEQAVVTDLVYTPLETRLIREAKSIGCRTVDGLGMLIHQAVPGFERWFGTRPTVDEETRALLLAV
ncbi:shikimate 5-dehydrogenase [Rhodobacteraceae bacterium HTCC2150]|nr:shikimate 5-dehydrogenase [Rhodobacteraceae bacterium HTCC2150]